MSDFLQHECGVAMIRLLKPLSYYKKKYNTSFYALNKMYLMMEKQRNRGQDGVGLVNIKLDVKPGERFISRKRSVSSNPIQEVFKHINSYFNNLLEKNKLNDVNWLKENLPFTGEIFLGHLRYGTYGKNKIENCHPFLRQNNWRSRNLVLAGNFNMTNVDELFNDLIDLGQHPKEKADTVTILEKIGHFLDEENERIFKKYKQKKFNKQKISKKIESEISLTEILKKSVKHWDGGYVICGIMGHGDSFALRDPNGIRPGYYYADDEVVVIASERPVIQTSFNVNINSIKEIGRGNALIIKKSGQVYEKNIQPQKERKACSFERIYFSRGNDRDIYKERIDLGKRVFKKVIKAVQGDLSNTVFSYVPNTAEVSYYGLIKECHNYLNKIKREYILKEPNYQSKEFENLFNLKVRSEKIAIKDAKLRTFISADKGRDDLVTHIYDTTYGIVKKNDTLVIIDDSIVRGTTLRQSILRILDRLEPKKIIIVSSAPQIRYPDCYGIDMAKLGDFIAFQAAIKLINEANKNNFINEIYEKCKKENEKKVNIKNYVKEIYKPFSVEQISNKISDLLKPKGITSEVEIIYQSIEDLHSSCPEHTGDWYFSGNYPTAGGNKVANRAFINYVEKINKRAY
ncbi:MAG: amidophosphoribosyltransferase [Flavobacteriales bacterium]|nr:amidophosphoribosyltransferase [Flavobacteriales bacterium]|tara:strand:- start:5258 stop:7144 length:1887 start_codon:yes stop_codon:yes gene_type:complete